MKSTLTLNLDDAVREAALWEVDKPREEWLFSYPAELALLAGQVRKALRRLETLAYGKIYVLNIGRCVE